MLKRNLMLVLLAVSLTAITTGCAAKNNGGVAHYVDTPQYRIQQGLAILADVNKAATQAVIQFNRSGILTDDLTREILQYNGLVAQTVKSATLIQQSSRTDAEKATAIHALMRQLTFSPALKAFVETPQSNEVIAGVIAAITAVQSTISLVLASTGGAH